MTVPAQYPPFMLVSASPSAPSTPTKAETDEETTSDPSLLRVPTYDETFNKSRRRPSSSSSFKTFETSSDMSASSISLSLFSSVGSFETATSRSSNDLSDEPSDESRLKLTQSLDRQTTIVKREKSPIIIHKACRYDCHCRCHDVSATKPGKRSSLFKNKKPACTEPSCENEAFAEKVYSDHSSRFRRALSQVMTSKSIKVRYNLNTYRMIPEGSDVMRYVKHGNLEKPKSNIESGEATIWDTAPDGWSLLHVSDSYARLDTCLPRRRQLLITANSLS